MPINNNISQKEPICAIATPPGRGALAIVRLSGKGAYDLAKKITQKSLPNRKVCFSNFYTNSEVIDQGIAIYFQAPASFTGEDVVEFHCHGNPLVAEKIIKELCVQGARLANAGEFSMRAFLNDKIDLTQAEAIVDLINSKTEQGVRTATRSLQGAFSRHIKHVLTLLIQTRMHIEANLDFPDEEIDRKENDQILSQLQKLVEMLSQLLQQAKLGERLQHGATIAIAGRPNAGKSSLLNTLAQSDVAIVTEIPGTTRDPLTTDIEIQGIPVRLIDTAGLRETQNIVEVEGIARAQQALMQADLILWLIDVNDTELLNTPEEFVKDIDSTNLIQVFNKIDLLPNKRFEVKTSNSDNAIYISVKNDIGIDKLLALIFQHLIGKNIIEEVGDTPFLARNRHVVALQHAQKYIQSASDQLEKMQELELVAEDLHSAQQYLSEITGEFTSDNLLGKIFTEFCIGK